MSTDRNLLFGVLALQSDLIDAQQFAEICSLWSTRKKLPLSDRWRRRHFTPRTACGTGKCKATKCISHRGTKACSAMREMNSLPVSRNWRSDYIPKIGSECWQRCARIWLVRRLIMRWSIACSTKMAPIAGSHPAPQCCAIAPESRIAWLAPTKISLIESGPRKSCTPARSAIAQASPLCRMGLLFLITHCGITENLLDLDERE